MNNRKSFKAFTLVELLVVIGIIAVLVGILLPALNRARAQSQIVACLSNLRQVGMAFEMYAGEHKGYLPYPTTAAPFGEQGCWYTAIDRYLGALNDARRATAPGATNVAAVRAYTAIKQDPVWQSFPDTGGPTSTSQGSYKENSRTYKMNTYLRHLSNGVTPNHAKITEVHHSENFVMMADAIGYDVSPGAGDTDSSRFSCQVGLNNKDDAYIFLRHRNSANIVFVDGHAANVALDMVPVGKACDGANTLEWLQDSTHNTPPIASYRIWWSPYLLGNNPVYPLPTTFNTSKPEALGYKRNPKMPLIWMDPPTLTKLIPNS